MDLGSISWLAVKWHYLSQCELNASNLKMGCLVLRPSPRQSFPSKVRHRTYTWIRIYVIYKLCIVKVATLKKKQNNLYKKQGNINFVYGFNYTVWKCQTMENENLPNFSKFIYMFMYDAVYSILEWDTLHCNSGIFFHFIFGQNNSNN